MATEIGSIKALIGTASATSSDGTQRNLNVGDKVYASDIITTGVAGAIEIEFADGSLMDLGRSSQAILDAEVFTPQQDAQVTASVESDVEALQQALLDGADPTQTSQAPAAGGGAQGNANEGSSTVTVDYLAPLAPVTNGFETTGPSVSFIESIEDTGLFVSPLTDSVPTVSTTSVEDYAYEFTITNHDYESSAGYNSSYGYYIKGADGNPESGVVVWDNVKDSDTTPVTISGYTPDQIGFFIIPNGDRLNSSLTDGAKVTFSQDGHNNWQATLEATGTPLKGSGAHVYFDDVKFNNSDSKSHVDDNKYDGNQNWEDLPILTGDGDYNDVNTNVTWTKVTVSGDALGDISYGTASAGTINFSLVDSSITGGLTFDGSAVSLKAVDTDSDGFNDQIVGEVAGTTVLTIDGILDSNEYDVKLFGDNPDGNLAFDAQVQVSDNEGDVTTTTLSFNINTIDSLLATPSDF